MAHRHHHRGRGAVVVVLLLVGALLTPTAVLARWAHETVTSTDGYVAVVDDLAADPQVRAALVDHLTAVTLEQIGAEALVATAVAALEEARGSGGSSDPARTAALGAPLQAAMEALVREVLTSVLSSDAFARVWSQANRTAHTAALAVLSGDGRAVSLSDAGEITLDLAPVVDLARAELVARGVSMASSIPDVDATVPLATSQELVTARSAFSALEALAAWLPWVAALALLGAVALARRRARVLAWGAGLVLVLTVSLGLAVVLARSAFLASLTGPELRTEVTTSVAAVLGDSVLEALRAGVVVAGVLALGAVLAWTWARRAGQAGQAQPAGPTTADGATAG